MEPDSRRLARFVPPAHPVGSEDVLRAIAARAARLRAGGDRNDGLRLALVVEGGAMRGVVSGGTLVGLEDLGLGAVFDVAYGASAGALNLAYFVTGQAGHAASIYTEHATSAAFVNPMRLHKIIDLDWLFERVIHERFPLDEAGLRLVPTELRVSVTSATTGRNALLSMRDPSVDPHALLKASAAVLFYYGRSVPLAGDAWVDGMASNALPVRDALDAGSTHVLVVLSARPREGSARPGRHGAHDIAWPERLMLLRHAPGFRRAYLTRRRRLRRELALASRDPRVHVILPGPDCLVPSRISRDRVALEAACEGARKRAHALFAPFGLTPRD